jgi:hypothetical protein
MKNVRQWQWHEKKVRVAVAQFQRGGWQWLGGSGCNRREMAVRFEWCIIENVNVNIDRDT